MAEEESIRGVLADSQRRHIAKFCIEPHSSDEILKSLREIWKDYLESQLASDLRSLENVEAAVYMEDKWKTTDPAKKVLKKYFGYRG